MSEQIDIAVDLGVIPPPLPEILTLRQLVEIAPVAPPQIIDGVLHVRSKMILGGTSKSNKSWCLLDLAISVASGVGVVGMALQQDVGAVYQFRAACVGDRATAEFFGQAGDGGNNSGGRDGDQCVRTW